jgi:YggT family protein
MSYLQNAGTFLLDCIFLIAIGIFVLRFVLIAVGASFYEPLCRAVYSVTNPAITPLRRVVPSWRRFELASLLLAWLLMLLKFILMTVLLGAAWRPLALLALAFVTTLDWLVLLELGAIFIFCLLSFFPSVRYDSNYQLLGRVIEPVWAPFRRVIPPLGVLDLSCWAAMIALTLVRMLVIMPLTDLAAHLP